MNKHIKRIIVKVGSRLIDSGKDEFISSLAEQIKEIKESGSEVIIVTSGAIVIGIRENNLKTKPKTIEEKQAFAAIGQPLLIRKYVDE